MNKMVVSNKLSFGKQDFKYSIGYKDAKKIRSLYKFPPKMSINEIFFIKLDLCIFQ